MRTPTHCQHLPNLPYLEKRYQSNLFGFGGRWQQLKKKKKHNYPRILSFTWNESFLLLLYFNQWGEGRKEQLFLSHVFGAKQAHGQKKGVKCQTSHHTKQVLMTGSSERECNSPFHALYVFLFSAS